ncbi:MAG: 6-phosphogluconolactonase [Thermoleophilia bacterium]|nr:6-phosphogluconolactonase [Thermoleophilia bacterium]
MGLDIFVTPDAEAAATAAAGLLAEAATAGGSIVLAGGSTPQRAYELAAELHSDWGDAEVWFGDDRCVSPQDPRSNQLLVRQALIDRLVVPPTVRAMATTLPPDAAAALYDAALTDEVLDLVLLGLGPDGHTASLFPDAPSLDVTDRLAVVAEPGLEPFVQRITLTIPALEAGRHVVFLSVGEGKAPAVRRAFGEEPSRLTPASLVRSRQGVTTVILDEAAASLLG